MAGCIFVREAFAPTPSLPKPGDFRTIEPFRVCNRGVLGWEGTRQGGLGSLPLGQRTMISAVLSLKCS